VPRVQIMTLSIIALLASFLYNELQIKIKFGGDGVWSMEHLDSFSSAPTLLGPSF